MDTSNTTINEMTAWFAGDTSFWFFFIGMWVVCLLLQVIGNKWLGKDWMQKLSGDDCHCGK